MSIVYDFMQYVHCVGVFFSFDLLSVTLPLFLFFIDILNPIYLL